MKKMWPMRPKLEFAVLALLCLAALLSYLLINQGSRGGVAVITVGQQVFAEVPLALDGEYRVTDMDGAYLLTCIVADGAIQVSSSTCRDHICVRQGDIHLTREMIVCLPNQVVVSIRSSAADELDGVVK